MMDIAEMVDQLIEKKLGDYVDDQLLNYNKEKTELKNAVRDVIAEKVTEKIKERKAEILEKAGKFLDEHDFTVNFGYRGIEVSIVKPEEDK